MIQRKIFDKISKELTQDDNVLGIMLMGSVATNQATPESDLDIMILGQETAFKTETVDNILVEYIFTTYQNRLGKILENDMEVYHFLKSEIVYDPNHQLEQLRNTAIDKYENFKTKKVTKEGIAHWLKSVKIKLNAAINTNDLVKQNFLVATNSWPVIEAIWAVNDKPTPPSSSVLTYKKDLTIIPQADWFEQLFSNNLELRVKVMLEIIDWVLPKLSKDII